MMPKKKGSAGAIAKNARSKTQFKKRSDHFPHIEAGYTYPKQCIDELLKLAGADTSPQSRRDLVNMLQLAQLTYDDERERGSRQRPPPKQITQFENSIEKTLTLLRSIREYKDWRNIGFVTHPVGRGVVDVATTQEMIRGRVQELPRHPSISDQELIFPTADGMVAAINIEPLLRATLIRVQRSRRGRGGPKKLFKEAVVFYAEQFFRRHSPKKPSTDPANPFHPFVERFYEVVTKTKPSGFDRQTRKIFRAKRSGH